MRDSENHISYFARTNFRNRRRIFGICQNDRRYHTLVIGKTGMGKSSLIEQFISEDLRHGRGFMLVDPHGDLYESVRKRIPIKDEPRLVDLNLPVAATRLSFNPLRGVPEEQRILVASSMLYTFKKLWSSFVGARFEHFLRNALISVLYLPNSTLKCIPRIFQDASFRRRVIPLIKNEEVRRFWNHEFEKIPPRYRAETIAPILNRTGAFLSNPVAQELLTSNKPQIDLKDIIDSGKILLVNLAKGKVGEDTAYLIGGLLISSLETATLGRADTPEGKRTDFNVYADEFASYSNPTLASSFSEYRKYRVALLVAAQNLTQIEPEVREAILGNVGTIISFRLGSTDARVLAREFHPKYSFEDFQSLPAHNIYLRMVVDAVVTKPFSAETLDPRLRHPPS